jgi:iron complex outermembrane receptor protein
VQHFNKPVAAICLAVASAFVQAQQSTYDFDIPAQPAGQVLDALAKQTGLQPFYAEGAVKGARSPGVKGKLSLREALDKALAGTGLTYQFTGEKAVAIKAAPAEKVAELAPITVTSSTTKDATLGYQPKRSFAGTKTDTPLLETPMAVQVVTRELMDDQKATTVKSALDTVSAVRPQTTLQRGNDFLVRGFKTRPYRDGLTPGGTRVSTAAEFDSAVVDRVEVVKGPAAVLYGRSEPGGLINLVTKRPLEESYHAVELQGGSYDFKRLEWDTTGPVSEDGRLLYRFAGAWQDNESFRDFRFNKSLAGLLALTWKVTDSTRLLLDLESRDGKYRSDRGVFALGDRPAPVPVTRSFGEPNDPVDNTKRTNLALGLEHEFNADWRVKARILQSDTSSVDFDIKPANLVTASTFLDPATTNRLYPRNIFYQKAAADTIAGNVDLTGHFTTGTLKHNVLVGLDYFRSTGSYETHGNFLAPIAGLAIDIYNPVYGTVPDSAYTNILGVNFGNNLSRFLDQWKGVYVQDHITYAERWHLLLGGRYDWAETGRGSVNGGVGTMDDAQRNLKTVMRKDQAFSPRAGLLYQWQPWLSGYASWTRSFGTNNGVSSTGGSFDPEVGEQYEVGLKAELLDKRLLTTASLFRITKDNVLTADLATPDPNDSATIGQMRSQGLELEAVGQVTDALSLNANYSYLDTKITKDNRGLEGHRFGSVPRHAVSLWGKYRFPSGWTFGLGGIAVSERQGDNENTFILPGFTRIDSMLAYSWKASGSRMTAQLTVRNLLNKHYYESTDPFSNAPPRVGIYPGELRSAMLSIKAEF